MGLPLVISDYRHKKILKRFKVTPVDKSTILTVEVFVYAIYSIISLLFNYIIARLFFNFQFIGSIPLFIASYFLVMFSTFSIGMMVGGIAPNIKIASVIASILYFPMLIFSGATLPYEVMPTSLQKISDILPLTQGIKLLKNSSLNLPINDVITPIISMLVISIICILISIKFFRWE